MHLPNLRQHVEDIPLLAAHFLQKAATTHEIQAKKLSRAAQRLGISRRVLITNIQELGLN